MQTSWLAVLKLVQNGFESEVERQAPNFYSDMSEMFMTSSKQPAEYGYEMVNFQALDLKIEIHILYRRSVLRCIFYAFFCFGFATRKRCKKHI